MLWAFIRRGTTTINPNNWNTYIGRTVASLVTLCLTEFLFPLTRANKAYYYYWYNNNDNNNNNNKNKNKINNYNYIRIESLQANTACHPVPHHRVLPLVTSQKKIITIITIIILLLLVGKSLLIKNYYYYFCYCCRWKVTGIDFALIARYAGPSGHVMRCMHVCMWKRNFEESEKWGKPYPTAKTFFTL